MRQAEARPASLRGLWALGTRNDEGAVLVVYGRNWPSVPVPSITTNTRFGAAARHALWVVVSNVAPDWGVSSLLVTSARRAPPGHFYSGRGAARALVTLPRDVAYDNAKSPRVNSHQCRKCSEARS